MFQDDLNNIFKDIYILVHKFGFDANYIESIPPIERSIYLMYAKEEQEASNKANKPKEMMMGQPIDPLGNNGA